MAEAFLRILMDNLSSLIRAEIGLIMGVDNEMKKLASNLTMIQAVLEDAEDKQLKDKAIRDWLRKLNDLSYEIDDVLDECATEVSKSENQKNLWIKLPKILYRQKIGRRMKKLTKKLDAVNTEREKFHLRETTIVLRNKVPAVTRETGSVLNKPRHVYGRDDEQEKIVDILVNQVKDHQELSILPIIGIGGLGKTTLAQQVFNDSRVMGHFDIKFWACVSENFDLKTLTKAMLESITLSGNTSNLEHMDSLQQSLWQLLNQKRYLLVLDDVWNSDQEKWSMLRDLLACGSTGSSIIVTTRLKKVADIMSTVPPCSLKPLSEKHCWLLFKQRAFAQEEGEHANLEAIGKEIVKKCAGVPLAAKALGGLLRFKRNQEDWERVKKSEIWNMPEEESLILPSLRLSYNHLPYALRQCFAYFAIFPKDSYIEKDEVILQWIAHGFISPDERFEVEDIGNAIFNELVLRSLLENVRTFHGPRFQMHDLIHDLAESIAENKVPGAQVETKNMQTSNNKIRQVVLRNKLIAFPKNTSLDMDLSSVFAKFCRLRVLHAGFKRNTRPPNESYIRITEVPREIRNLKHLRYLNLAKSEIKSLPDSICSLWNLKILNLNVCQKLTSLPKRMCQLHNLRHLFLENCIVLKEMPPKIGELASLKTLSRFVVGRERGNQLDNQLGELQLLNLRGTLTVGNLERVQEKHLDVNKPNLAGKKNLRGLHLMWNRRNSSKLLEVMDEKVLEALEPHVNVTYLSISGFRGKNFPFWMRSSTLENLDTLSIDNCPHCSSIPPVLGDLPHLKTLFLARLQLEYIVADDVQGFNASNPKFPALKKLHLHELPNLKGLLKEEERKSFPNLQELYVKQCSLLSLSQLPSVERLNCSGVNLTTFDKLDNVTWLGIRFDKKGTCVPKENQETLTCHIRALYIYEAEEHSLTEEWLQGLKSLARLRIADSDKLKSLPDSWFSHLTALNVLILVNCSQLVEISESIKYLHNLTLVELEKLPKMVSVPSALQHVTSLLFLGIYHLSELTSLPDWLHNVTSLHALRIDGCPKLKSFPDSIQKSELKSLGVMGCPELERRCEKGKEDWLKIAHIRDLKIGETNPFRVIESYDESINLGFTE